MLRNKLLVPALALPLLCLACNNKPSDDSINTSIQAKMYGNPQLKSANVNVSTQNGVVTLTGQVPDDAARLAAEQIVTGTPGVKTVVDRTTTAPAGPLMAENVTPRKPEKPRRAEKPARAASKPAPVAAPTPAPAPAPPAPPADVNPGPLTKPADAKPDMPAPPPPPPAPKPINVTIPEGTIVTIRTIDSIDSKENHAGQLFRASLDSPIVVGDQVVVPKGLNAYLKLVDASSAGKFKGRSELTISFDSFTYQGKTYQVASSDVQEKGGSRGKRSAEVIGGGAALGALIGGLAGGGKGAAIGAGIGAGSGTAVQALTHGEQVKIPSETRLDFTLHDPVTVTYFPKKNTPRPSQADAPSDGSTDTAPPASADQPPQR